MPRAARYLSPGPGTAASKSATYPTLSTTGNLRGLRWNCTKHFIWSRPQVTPKKNRNEIIRALNVLAEIPFSVIFSCYDCSSSGVAVSGKRPRKAAKCFTFQICAFWVCSPKRRVFLPSVIRWRSGLIFYFVMGTS